MDVCGKLYHIEHFKCTNCDKVLGDTENYFEHEEEPYCESCNNQLFLRCPRCNESVKETDDGLSALNKNWHRECFTCRVCDKPFKDNVYFTKDNDDGHGESPYCEEHYLELFGSRCRACQAPIRDKGIVACGSSWHPEHFVCTHCGDPFPDSAYYEQDGLPYCKNDYLELFAERCAGCGLPMSGEVFNAMGKKWHTDCFSCAHCHKPFPDNAFFEKDGKPYCETDFKELFCERCFKCKKPILGERLEINDVSFHEECVTCSTCDRHLDETTGVFMDDDKNVFCEEHYSPSTGFDCHVCGKSIESEDSVPFFLCHDQCFMLFYSVCLFCCLSLLQVAMALRRLGDNTTLRV